MIKQWQLMRAEISLSGIMTLQKNAFLCKCHASLECTVFWWYTCIVL